MSPLLSSALRNIFSDLMFAFSASTLDSLTYVRSGAGVEDVWLSFDLAASGWRIRSSRIVRSLGCSSYKVPRVHCLAI